MKMTKIISRCTCFTRKIIRILRVSFFEYNNVITKEDDFDNDNFH